MKTLTVLTTITNPEERGDAWIEALNNYLSFADQVVVVNGGKPVPSYISHVDIVDLEWPEEWSWEELPKHLNAGFERCTSDWVLKLDIDQFIHEKDFKELKDKINERKEAVLTLPKYNVIPHGKYFGKSEVPCLINMEYRTEIAFGQGDSKSDLCVPIVWEGKVNEKGVPIGKDIPKDRMGRIGVYIWNFDYIFKTLGQAKKEWFRFAKAYQRYFGEAKWGSDYDGSWERFIRSKQYSGKQNLEEWMLPEAIKERYKNMTDEEFGKKGWGLV